MKLLSLLLLAIVFYSEVASYKILLYNPKYGYSHLNFMGTIADMLVDGGHDVTVLMPVMLPKYESNGSKKAKLIQYKIEEESTRRTGKTFETVFKSIWQMQGGNPLSILAPISMLADIFDSALRVFLDNSTLIEELKAEKFDIGITELFDFSAFGMFHQIGLTNVVGTHTAGLLEGSALSVGAPVLPSYVPSSMSSTSDDTSFSTRAMNTLNTFLAWYFEHSLLQSAQTVLDKKLGSAAPSVQELVNNVTWYVTNSEPLIDFPKPSIHTVVELGGLGVKTGSPLDEYWNGILSLRKKTVLVSFGSVASSYLMSDAMKTNLVNTFEKFPEVTFIWKYEKPEHTFASHVKNIVLSKWTPQNDLLADDRLSGFITHGGAGSTYEAATLGKPLLAVPLFADQGRNARMMVRMGMAIMFEKSELTNKDLFYNAVHKLINDEELSKKAKHIRAVMAARPVSAKDKLLHTIKMAGQFGPQPLLRPAGTKLGYIAYYNVDVLLVAFFSVVLALIVLLVTLRYVLKLIFSYLVKTDGKGKKHD